MLQKSPLYAYLPAADMDRARRFYEGTLGFVPKSLENEEDDALRAAIAALEQIPDATFAAVGKVDPPTD